MLKRLGVILPVLVALCAALLFPEKSLWFRFPTSKSTLLLPSYELNLGPDVTAVLLNWARFSNVVQIVTVLCGEALHPIIKEVVVWNNAYARPLVYDDFANCNCSKLRIHNSPDNLYFKARFMACSNASTAYCFIQDDDYLIQPDIIRSLRARISTHDIFVLPPDEVLSGHLLSINSPSTNITFRFSWLGYGALILRSHAESFLSLLRRIGASDEETKMADNYYSILKNRIPELWTSVPTTLFGGGAFTVGEEGATRNRRHIASAAKYLDEIVSNHYADRAFGNDEWPYVSLASSPPEPRIERSPCLENYCLLESTISSIPDFVATETYKTAGEIFSREEQLSRMLSEHFKWNYLNFPLSHAVDADPVSFFRSAQAAAEGETLILDVFDRVQKMNWTHVKWSWLVDAATVQTLRSSIYSYSSDKQLWVNSSGSVSCVPHSPQDIASSSAVWRCHVLIDGPNNRLSLRYFRLEVRQESMLSSPWVVYETWIAPAAEPI